VLDSGRLNNQGPIDDPIIRDYKIQMVSPLTQWLWRVTESTTTPFPQNVLSAEDHSHHFTFSYDAFGNLTDVYGDLVGTMPLDRFHENPAKPFAPPPAQASKDGSVHLLHMTYDSVGNVTQTKGTNAACSEVVFDPIYRQLAVEKTVFTGGCTPLGGGTGPLTVIRDFDRGLGLVTHITDPTGAIAKFEYEPFGRVRAVYAPDPANLGKTGIQPAITMQYIDGNSVTQPVHTRVRDSATTWRDSWVLTDGFGRVVLTFRPADPSGGDGGQWIAGGLSDHSANGLLTRNYEPWFFTGDPSQLPGDPSQTVSPPAHSLSVVYDAFGRISKRIGFDGNTTSLYKYHALSVDIYDAANLGANGTPVTVRRNGHGRIIEVSAILREQGRPVNTISTHMRYLSNGEVTNITQSRSPSLGYDNIVRWMQYDSFGRLVLNSEPNTSVNFKPSPANSGGMKAWRYAYNDRGDLVGSSDARGCGANFSYDGVGRIVAEDYSPCLVSQPDYSPPDPTSGDGTETLYRYDAPEPGQTEDFGGNAAFLVGRLVSVSDRGAHTRFAYDGRGRVTGVARQLAKPGDPSVALTDRYAPWWYRVATSYDEVDRIISQTTGADVPDLLGLQGGSIVNFDYTARGIIKDIGGSYGVLLKNETRDADGLALGEEYGDVASTHTVRMYDTSRRPVGYWLSRSAPMLWSAPTGSYTPPSSNPSTLPLLLESNIWSYDDVGNIKSVTDGRNQGEWPAGAKPVSRTLEYDSFNRLSSVLSEYGPNGDIQVLPFAAEVANGDKSPVPASIFPKRIQSQSFTWDWKGNMSASDDDTHRLWDRSLGQIVNGQPSNRPNALFSAGPGIISSYDAAGNLVNLVLRRQGTCEGPTNDCSQRFDYDWDEVGQLARARRWDYSAIPSNEPLYPAAPSAPMAFDISYKYSIGSRVLKSVLDSSGSQLHSAQIFSSLRLVRAKWDSTLNTYERSPETEAVYLAGLGRLYYSRQNLPSLTGSSLHVLLEFPDRLGSTSTVIDRDTSELIEKITYEATGAPESDYRPDRWGNFREAYRLNGKEDDIEIGLVYFGARYYHPSLGRWISPDPLAVHSFRGDLNPYAYVGGSPLQFVDPRGLCTDLGKEKQCNDQSDGSGDGDGYESGSGSTGDGGNGGGYRSGYCDVFGCAAPGPPPPPPPSCTACGVYDVALNQFFAGTWQGAMAQVNKDFADTARGLRDSVISAVQGLFARPKVVERLIGPNPVFSLLEGLKVAPSERTGPYSAGMILGSIGMVLIPGMGEEKTVTELEILGSGKPYPIQASSAAQGALLRQQLAAEEAAGLQMPRSLTGYRYHGLDQAISREGVGVSHEAIFDAWQNPVNIAGQSGGRFLIQGRNADIVVNSEGQIITTWAHGSTGFRGAP
jgi:RHS repeat-associated protein